jgi:xanthine dehydrogenase YagS FAD-binding subunit
MQPFSYTSPRSAQEAVTAFADAGKDARFIAGGEHLRFEALALMSAVAADTVVARDYPVLAEALLKAASQQIRNMATVGGNLLQKTRCMYFRNGANGIYPCNKREPGSGCSAIGGLDRGQAILGASASCTAVSPGDWPVALLAMDASIEVLGPQGTRTLPIGDLYRLPGDTPHVEFTLEPGEMITAIVVPKTSAGLRSTYHKIRDRESYAFALASAAVALEMDGDVVSKARIALGGVATRPWRAVDAEQMIIGKRLTPDGALAAGHTAFNEARPGRHNGFKVELGARTVGDALLIASERNRT